MSQATRTYDILVEGLVQGVGFRPFIYRLAREYGLKGWVKNTNSRVHIRVTAPEAEVRAFMKDIPLKAPAVSRIENIGSGIAEKIEEFEDFIIASSSDESQEITAISPDMAVCSDCLADMERQPNRTDYPFVNCTHCGPRFTIITDLPYDRKHTTMVPFTMCPRCRKEYEDVLDRRFHAQPVACLDCGPRYRLITIREVIDTPDTLPEITASVIDGGGILAIKGMGGYHLACDALNEAAVQRLRKSKIREGKPFAVMFRDLAALKEYALVDTVEEKHLLSWQRPILILQERSSLAPSVSNGFHTIGAMLPYMPIHYLLFRHLKTPAMVLTSGNLSDEPIMTGNMEATEVLGSISDGILEYNRDIHNRTDDSVMMVVNERPRMLRRSRGFVPNPVNTGLELEGIFAAGAELVNCFAIGRGRQAIISQHIGDLKNTPTYLFYRESYERFVRMFRLQPALVAHDLHPDYLSTRFAMELGLETCGVQHHHAHMASVMAEHRLAGPCLGVLFDGTGYGTDGQTWGGEFLFGNLVSFERLTRFRYVPMPGGDAVIHEPWRMGLAYLYDAFGEETLSLGLPLTGIPDSEKLSLMMQALQKGFHTPLTCSAGRLFDAVAAITGVCTHAGFHAEAPMRLENAVQMGTNASYPFQSGEEIDFRPTIRALVEDVRKKTPVPVMAARFHQTIIKMAVETVTGLSRKTGCRQVILSGGSFQNRILLENLEKRLGQQGMEVYTHGEMPANDGGIALGQLAVAAARRR